MSEVLSAAIALSTGNKAKARNERGDTIVVQELVYSPVLTSDWCLHVWIIDSDGFAMETDIPFRQGHRIKEAYDVDPNAKIWESM